MEMVDHEGDHDLYRPRVELRRQKTAHFQINPRAFVRKKRQAKAVCKESGLLFLFQRTSRRQKKPLNG